MQIIITGKNVEVTDALRDYINKKISKLEKFSRGIIKAEVVLEIQRNWQKVEVTVRGDGFVARGEERADDMYVSIDAAADKLEKQLKRFKEKTQKKGRVELPAGVEEPLIVRRKAISLRAMSEGEAVEQMELLGHDFYLFLDSATKKPSLVYRRRGGGYGLITTE